jgi:hypothetical protein
MSESAPSVPQAAQLRAWLRAVLHADDEGYLYVALGTGRYRDAHGKYRHDNWSEHPFTWPSQAGAAVTEMVRAASIGDVYCCPYLMKTPCRAKGNAVTRRLAHADVDTATTDLHAARELGGLAVASGTHGHTQVYVRLSTPVNAGWHETLCRALAARLGGDAKYADNDLLRPPGTMNHKPTLTGEQPAPVRMLLAPAATCIDPHLLVPEVVAGPCGQAAEPFDIEAHPLVATAFHTVTGDRSVDTYRLVGACYTTHKTLAQTRWAVAQRRDLTARLNGQRRDDVLACWLKVVDEHQTGARQTREGG